ncbi:hypothetical protein BC936DRAFT_149827 [Jimgerdemannia flammicorona]|uniref:Prolyl endopeptidase-like n=1 Tax=Jimgerdemannia flammicorona TaxID=994334 RepID=A0A433DMZ7_9FUNG|nr:hypothetical protein BC936DRAFT_149827 [Jimgerdemannia flammicorona]
MKESSLKTTPRVTTTTRIPISWPCIQRSHEPSATKGPCPITFASTVTVTIVTVATAFWIYDFLELTCSPAQLVRFIVPATCVIIIMTYTITIAVLVDQRRMRRGPYLSERYVGPPPAAKQVTWERTLHGDTVVDKYNWLRNIDSDRDVFRYILEERNYTRLTMQPTQALQEKLVGEMKEVGRSVRFRAGSSGVTTGKFWEQGEHVYWVEYPEGKGFPVYKRQSVASFAYVGQSSISPIETILDTNTLSNGGKPIKYMHIGAFEVSIDGKFLAYSVDFLGSERYELYLKDLKPDGAAPAKISESYDSVRWARIVGRDYIYYNAVDTLGVPKSVYRYCAAGCGDGAGEKELVYQEEDQSMIVEVSVTSDDNYLLIKTSNEATSETRYINLSQSSPSSNFTIMYPRVANIKYDLQHRNGQFYVRTNRDNSPNYKIIRTPAEGELPPPQTILVQHSDDRFIERMELFADHLVLWVVEDESRSIVVVDLEPEDAESHEVLVHSLRFEAEIYSLMPGTITHDGDRLYRRFDATTFTFTNSSFLSPPTVWEYDMDEHEAKQLARANDVKIDAGEYTELRIRVPASSTSTSTSTDYIPVILVTKTSLLSISPPSPLVLSIGSISGDVRLLGFDPTVFSLLDRGVAFAIVQLRGAERWRGTAVMDVRRVLGELVKTGYAERGRIAVYARGENGLVAGNAVTRWGHVSLNDSTTISGEDDDRLVRVVVTEGPFMDVITDMMDERMPWVAYERSEWGDPNNRTIYDAMRVYNPYDQIRTRKSYPATLVTAGLNDIHVRYHDAVKFVAKLRDHKDNDPACHGVPEKEDHEAVEAKAVDASVECTPLLVEVGDLGRFHSDAKDGGYAGVAFWYAFVLDQLGVVNTKARLP